MNITPYQAKYFAHEIGARKGGEERLTQALFDARVKLHPHQIEAALAALNNPLQEGVLLADEVGLGKTVEAGLVLCQMWAERKRRLLVICPASLRMQWQAELESKFALPAMIVDKAVLKGFSGSLHKLLAEKGGQCVFVMSYEFAARHAGLLAGETWDYVALDEAHKLRNTHRQSSKTAQALKSAFSGRRKMLLSATPLQNSLMEFYGLSAFLDEYLFGDEKTFRKKYIQEACHDELKARLKGFVQRTLRKNVAEYVRYTDRHALTQQFTPDDDEHAFYEAVSDFLHREESLALPKQQRHLTGMVVRKLLASSPDAVTHTLKKLLARLESQTAQATQADWLSDFPDEDFSADWQEGFAEEGESEAFDSPEESPEQAENRLAEETRILRGLIAQAVSLKSDSKAKALLIALQTGFAGMRANGAPQKAVIFTESVRTQKYLFDFLEQNGYAGKAVMFSGSNNSPHANAVYQNWRQSADPAQLSGSPDADKRNALIDAFKHQADILIATEAGAEGINLQFCALVINYDLPWNPQRVEQRIGRCHRYGQAHDVVVINFLNSRNEADKRVLELLTDKFHLFDGVFGASDEILGRVESGVGFEKRVADIYARCRTSHDIQAAFDALQEELKTEIQAAMDKAGRQLNDFFGEDVHARLDTEMLGKARLDSFSRFFWLLSRFALKNRADFDEQHKTFRLNHPPAEGIRAGLYALPAAQNDAAHAHRLSAPLGQWCLAQGLAADTPIAEIRFDYAAYGSRVSVLEQKTGQSGWLRLDKITFRSEVSEEEQLLFTALTDAGECLDEDFCRKLMRLPAIAEALDRPVPPALTENAAQAQQGAIARKTDENLMLFKQESARLDHWADDQKAAAEQDLEEAKKALKEAKKQKDQAANMQELLHWEKAYARLEKQLRHLRNKIWETEEDIDAQRDAHINVIKEKIAQKSSVETVFCVRWRVV